MQRIGRRLHSFVRKQNEWLWVPALYVAALVALYWPMFFSAQPVGMGWDTLETYWPDLAAYKNLAQHGSLPLWSPFEKGGNPFLAVAERAPFYPVNWLLAGVGTAIGDVPWWLGQTKQLLHHLIAAVSMHAFLRSRSLPVHASIAGSFAWIASTPMFLHKASGIIWPIAWVPLLWLCIDRCVEKPNWRRAAALGFVIFLAGSAGSPPGFFYALLLTAPYALFRAISAVAKTRGQRRKQTLQLAVAGLITCAVAAALLWVQLAPIAELTTLSQRANRTIEYAMSFSLPAAETWLALLTPYTHSPVAYPGLLALALALAAVIAVPRKDGGVAVFCVVFAALSISLATGSELLRFLAEHVPGFGLFRAANRYKLLAVPLLCVATGVGLAAVTGPDLKKNQKVRLLATLLLTVLTSFILAYVFRDRADKGSPPVALAGALLLTATGLLAAAHFARKSWANLVLALLLPLFLYDSYRVSQWRGHSLESRPKANAQSLLAQLEGAESDWRIYDEFVLEQRAGSRLGLREFRGYPAGGSLEYQRYAAVLAMAKRQPEILEAFNIRYLLHGRHHRTQKRANHLKRPAHEIRPEHFERSNKNLSIARHALPRVAWFAGVEVVAGNQKQVLSAVLNQERNGVRSTVVVEPEAPNNVRALPKETQQPMTAGEVIVDQPNRIVATIVAPSAGVVVVNETMYPGWKVRVEGRPSSAFYVNGLSRGVFVDAGSHTIEWRFVPKNHGVRLLLFWIAMLVVILAAIPRRERYIQTT